MFGRWGTWTTVSYEMSLMAGCGSEGEIQASRVFWVAWWESELSSAKLVG